jgi:hypothetical protein
LFDSDFIIIRLFVQTKACFREIQEITVNFNSIAKNVFERVRVTLLFLSKISSQGLETQLGTQETHILDHNFRCLCFFMVLFI